MPQTSILLPTYNGADYLGEQIASILRQTADDFELLWIDDGSTDATRAVMADFAARDGRIRPIAGDGNVGQVTRLRQLLSHAAGEFVAIADQDDIWEEDRNARLLAVMDGCAIAFGRSELIDAAGTRQGTTLLEKLGIDPAGGSLRALCQPRVSAHGAVIRRAWLDPAALSCPLPFDWLLGAEASLSAGLRYVPEAIVWHRIHGRNQMNNVNAGEGRFSRSHLRASLRYRKAMRLQFWLMLDYLGRAQTLAPGIRRTLAHCGREVYHHWYSPWRNSWRGSRAFMRDMERDLLALASDSDDAAFFRERAALLTGSAVNPAMLREARRRLAY